MITVVSGIPRSGTSLMMQMLSAGGLPILADKLRPPDTNNPRGYCEWAPAKSLPRAPQALKAADGKAVKIISTLLPSLSNQYEYRVIFMCRPLEEIVASQNKMLERLGKPVPPAATEPAIVAFRRHLDDIRAWLANQTNLTVTYVSYANVLENPGKTARSISDFLGKDLNVEAMSREVDHSLYHEKLSVFAMS
jgi:hypothetical protein